VVPRVTMPRKSTNNNEDGNQSMIADCAMDCETNRICNDNYRLDMTWVDQEVRQDSNLKALEQQAALVRTFHDVFI